MTMYDSREATLKAVLNFPRWMDIRKRMRTSTGGKYLQAIMSEQDDIKKAFKEFEDSFFLKTYLGHEDEVICQVYLAHVGSLDDIHSTDERYKITADPHKFAADTKSYALYQGGYVLLDPVNIDADKPIFVYRSNEQTYKVTAKKQDLWNIFDEFAMFSSLTRYEGETNSQLVNRILASFKRPTNGTEAGLKNAIINAVMNYDNLKPEEIQMEQPNGENMHLLMDSGKTVYDEMSKFNKDIAKEKVWNQSYWENGFKKMQYIPNVWDAPIEWCQSGTGQRNDLQAHMSGDDTDVESTDLEVTGYAASTIMVNEYIRKQGIKKNIPLQLSHYRDELISKDLRYRITATPAIKIDPSSIYLQSLQHVTGDSEEPISSLLIDKGNATEIMRGTVPANSTYTLKFVPREAYTDMTIDRCSFIDAGGKTTNLLNRQGAFRYDNGVFRNIDVKLHATNTNALSDLKNIVNDPSSGLTVGTESTRGQFSVNVTGMDGQPVILKAHCDKTNYTRNTDYVKLYGGFRYDGSDIICDTDDSKSQCVIELDCTTLDYDLVKASDPVQQGTISVQAEVDGEIIPEYSGLLTEGKTYSLVFDNLKHVKLTITKAGMYPVIIRNILAASYQIKYALSHGSLIYTKNYMKLPLNLPIGTMMTVYVESYSAYSPVIDYLHIGPSMERVSYELHDISSGSGGSFDIQTNCRVELYRVDRTGNEILTQRDYITRSLYRNATNDITTVFIDTSRFTTIQASSKPIYSGAYRGAITDYIELAPGEEIDMIRIRGERRVEKEQHPISDFFHMKTGDRVYVAGNAPGFIVLSENGDTKLVKITRKDFSLAADDFKFIGIPSGFSGVFVIDETNGVTNMASEFSRDFEYCYITTVDAQDYIAYNSIKLLQSPMENIDLVNTFSPYLDMNLLMFYYIDDITLDGKIQAKASFKHINIDGTEYVPWALGAHHAGIRAEYAFDYSNANGYQLSISNLNESFTISNNIELKDVYQKGQDTYELARYIIKPPENMRITYATETVQENIIAEEDGFNKLYFSNVTNILSIKDAEDHAISSSYKLLNEAGILVWSNIDQVAGKHLTVVYEYKKPKSLEFKDLSYLYEMVGYSTDAYEPLNEKPMTLTNVKDGDIRIVTINGRVPDKITVRCTNSNFYAVVTGNRVQAHEYSDASVAVVRSGYYYDREKEYYLFEHDADEIADCYENIEAHNIQNIADTIRTIQSSNNFIRDTEFTNGDHLETVCHIDCVEDRDRIRGISSLKALTACDTYQLWNDFNMEVTLQKGLNGDGLHFESEDASGYAYLDFTPYLDPEELMEISFSADENIHAYIMEEVLARDDSMQKSSYAEPIGECQRKDSFLYYILDSIKPEHRYYVLIKGSGTIDDMILRKKDDKPLEEIHHKNINVLNFNLPEVAEKDYTTVMKFDPNGNTFSDLEMDHAGVIETGSSADWGVTLLKNFREDFPEFIVKNVDLRKDVFYSRNEDGSITSPWIQIHDYKALDTIYIKINDMLIEPLRYFNIHLYTAEDVFGNGARELYYSKKTNLLEMKPTSLLPFVQIVVEMPPERVINNIEIYARYVENPFSLHVSPCATGSMITKVYNTTAVGNYRPRYMTGSVTHPENITISMRGYRQDNGHGVWTSWYTCRFDQHMIFASDIHTFEGYQYFQFKIVISDMNASIKIDGIIFEVI